MHIDFWTLGLQAVNVLILLWLLSRFLFRPVSAIIAARQQAATSDLDAARKARTEAEAVRAEAQAEGQRLAAERQSRLQAIQIEADQARADLLAAARTEVEQLREAAKQAMAREQQQAAQAAADQAGRLAVDIAARLLERLPDGARIDGFIDGLGEALAALPPESRAGIDGAAPIAIRAPRTLTPDEQAALVARLAAVLGQPVTVAVSVDADLLAGLEIDAPHAVIRNHFRADLERITAELSRHDQ